jgi:hypothetical protein
VRIKNAILAVIDGGRAARAFRWKTSLRSTGKARAKPPPMETTAAVFPSADAAADVSTMSSRLCIVVV